MHVANLAEYKEIWFQTQHAFNYLFRRGCEAYATDVLTDYEIARLICYHVCGANDRMKKHVEKTYPRALIQYVDEATVTAERQRREEDFNKKFRT